MKLPEDAMMLYSFINTKLRDCYPSLDALCEDMGIERSLVEQKLKTVGFEYNPVKNRFFFFFKSEKTRGLLPTGSSPLRLYIVYPFLECVLWIRHSYKHLPTTSFGNIFQILFDFLVAQFVIHEVASQILVV